MKQFDEDDDDLPRTVTDDPTDPNTTEPADPPTAPPPDNQDDQGENDGVIIGPGKGTKPSGKDV